MNPPPSTASRFRMPAEWEPQEAVWFSWPLNPVTWPDTLPAIQVLFVEIVATASRFQAVYLNAPRDQHARILQQLAEGGAERSLIRLFDIATNDAWCRDHGPVFVVEPGTGKRAILNFNYNAWGGKFPPWDLDNAVPARVAEALQMPLIHVPLTGEGGGLEVDGRGNMLNTESVWLNPNRNPGISPAELEACFKEFLGITRVCWMHEGLVGDDTDGHIDTLSRYIHPGLVVTCSETDPENPNHVVLARNTQKLKTFGQDTSHPFEVVELPLPSLIKPKDWREEILPATYANFLILNGAVLVPTYRQPASDDHALGVLRELFAKREVIGIDCYDLVLEGGALHCISQQMPAENSIIPQA